MKLIFLFLILFISINTYSQVSDSEYNRKIETPYKDVKKYVAYGRLLTIFGSISLGAGALINIDANLKYSNAANNTNLQNQAIRQGKVGSVLFYSGGISLAIGIPLTIVNKKRYQKLMMTLKQPRSTGFDPLNNPESGLSLSMHE